VSAKQDAGKNEQRPGWVALVGAGPGDEGLLTVRAAEVIGAADLIVADPEHADLAGRLKAADAQLVTPADGAAGA
jgi:siroheme synthase